MQINLFKCKYIHKGNSDMLYCFKNIDFLIPKEGGFVIIDNVVIPALSKKDDLIYKFINF